MKNIYYEIYLKRKIRKKMRNNKLRDLLYSTDKQIKSNYKILCIILIINGIFIALEKPILNTIPDLTSNKVILLLSMLIYFIVFLILYLFASVANSEKYNQKSHIHKLMHTIKKIFPLLISIIIFLIVVILVYYLINILSTFLYTKTQILISRKYLKVLHISIIILILRKHYIFILIYLLENYNVVKSILLSRIITKVDIKKYLLLYISCIVLIFIQIEVTKLFSLPNYYRFFLTLMDIPTFYLIILHTKTVEKDIKGFKHLQEKNMIQQNEI